MDEIKERADFPVNRNNFRSSVCLFYLTLVGLHMKILDVFPVNDLLLFDFGRVYATSMKNEYSRMKVRKRGTYLKLFSLANHATWFMQLPSVVHQGANTAGFIFLQCE